MELCDRLDDLKAELQSLQKESASLSPRHRGLCSCVCIRVNAICFIQCVNKTKVLFAHMVLLYWNSIVVNCIHQ